MKVSYSCIENISSIISSHNKKLIKNNDSNKKPCNCRNKSTCHLNGQCQSQDIIYKCTVSTSVNTDKVYLGTTEGDFNRRRRYHNHTKSFRNKRYTKDKSFQVYLENKGKTSRKSIFEIVSSQKSSCILQHYKKASFISSQKIGYC